MTKIATVRFSLIGESAALVSLYRNLTCEVLPSSTIVFVDNPAKLLKDNMACLPARKINQKIGQNAIKNGQADWLISVNNYDYIVCRETLNLFQGRTINLHFGDLPEYSGQLGYQWAIRNGKRKTAVVLHRMTFPLDSGDICERRDIPIDKEDTAFTIYWRCLKEGISLVSDVMSRLHVGDTIAWREQILSHSLAYQKAKVGDGKIDWTQASAKIVDFVRAADFGPFQNPSYKPWTFNASGHRIRVGKVTTVPMVNGVPKDMKAHLRNGRYFAQAADSTIEILPYGFKNEGRVIVKND